MVSAGGEVVDFGGDLGEEVVVGQVGVPGGSDEEEGEEGGGGEELFERVVVAIGDAEEKEEEKGEGGGGTLGEGGEGGAYSTGVVEEKLGFVGRWMFDVQGRGGCPKA